MRIVIDGYNFISAIPNLRARLSVNLETARNELNSLLARYKKARGHEITVVYDGKGGQWGQAESLKIKGVREIFTAKGEIADAVIIRTARKKPDGLMVVTADREVATSCAKAGAAVLFPAEFEEKIWEAIYGDEKGETENTGREIFKTTEKKGPSKRLKKSEKLKIRMKAKL